jgi:hypothetical protein
MPIVAELAVRLGILFSITSCVSDAIGMMPPKPDTRPVEVLTLNGTINLTLAATLEKKLSGHQDHDLVLDLNLLGGRADATLQIVELAKAQANVTAIVRDGHFCLSSCILIWAAAQERLAEPDAIFGFHGASCFPPVDLKCAMFSRFTFTHMMQAAARQTSPTLAQFLDTRSPPAFDRSGHDAVFLSGTDMVFFGAAAPAPAKVMVQPDCLAPRLNLQCKEDSNLQPKAPH